MVFVHFLDTETNTRKVVEYPYQWYYTDEETGELRGSDFIWEEGNYSCDCARLQWMYGPCPGTPDDDWECGQGRVKIEQIVLGDGITVVYEE
jgi:hypothetical protein